MTETHDLAFWRALAARCAGADDSVSLARAAGFRRLGWTVDEATRLILHQANLADDHRETYPPPRAARPRIHW